MRENIFLQTVIAVIWDFDTTLIPGYMQTPLFRHFGVDPKAFWDEVNGLPEFYQRSGATRVTRDTVYLNHILSYIRAGVFKGLNNALLKELGGKIDLYPGLPDFFRRLREYVAMDRQCAQHEVRVEHYIVSTGLKAMIEGSKIASSVDGIWACEFAEASAEPGYREKSQAQLFEHRVISEVAYTLDNTSKTRAVFEINKGSNKMPEIDVNSTVAMEQRRIPFQNMIYIADGPSDIPCFSLVSHFGGKTFAVYKPKSEAEFEKAYKLQKQHRVEAFGEADYTEGSQASMWIKRAVKEIAERIVRDRSRVLDDGLGQPPGHVLEQDDRRAAAIAPENGEQAPIPRKEPFSVSAESSVTNPRVVGRAD